MCFSPFKPTSPCFSIFFKHPLVCHISLARRSVRPQGPKHPTPMDGFPQTSGKNVPSREEINEGYREYAVYLKKYIYIYIIYIHVSRPQIKLDPETPFCCSISDPKSKPICLWQCFDKALVFRELPGGLVEELMPSTAKSPATLFSYKWLDHLLKQNLFFFK